MKLGALLFLFSTFLFAGEVKVGFGLTLAPYIFSKEQKGIEYDIIKKALEAKGHTMSPIFFNFKRLANAFQNDNVQAIATTSEQNTAIKDSAFFSDSHITYQNVAIGLKSKNLSVGSISDLKNHSLVSFSNATKYLGDEYKTAVSENKNYHEWHDQKRQVQAMYSGQIDLIVLDINIFKHIKAQLESDTSAEIVVYEVFPKTAYKVAFRNVELQSDFNAALADMKKSGELDKIKAMYVK